MLALYTDTAEVLCTYVGNPKPQAQVPLLLLFWEPNLSFSGLAPISGTPIFHIRSLSNGCIKGSRWDHSRLAAGGLLCLCNSLSPQHMLCCLELLAGNLHNACIVLLSICCNCTGQVPRQLSNLFMACFVRYRCCPTSSRGMGQ